LLLEREDLELHLGQLREDIRGRQRGGRRSLGGEGRRQRATVVSRDLLDVGEGEAFLACVIGMRDDSQTSLVQPQTQGFGIDAKNGTDVRQWEKIHDKRLLVFEPTAER
jgi:hypothetical protein